MSAISVQGLTKVFGPRTVVDDLTFDVPFDRVTGFLGPNGAGKSTTMRMILGLVHPTSGQASVFGGGHGERPSGSAGVGALLETQQFHPHRSARGHLRAFGAVAGAEADRIEELLELVDLSGAADRKVGEFSLGMRQRLGLATALLGNPRILVLDEPANGLDPSGIRWLRRFLRGFATGDRAVLVSSHLLGEIAQMADDVVVIDKGRLIVHAPVPDLVTRVEVGVEVRTEEPERLRDVLSASGHEVEFISHDTLRVSGVTTEVVGRAAATSGIALFKLDVEQDNLEDVFLSLTGSAAR